MKKILFAVMAGSLMLAACVESTDSDSSNANTNQTAINCSNADEPLVDERDGKTYRTVKIGDQVWMAENLNYDVPGSAVNDSIDKDGSKYGRYYSLEQSKVACPEGWHLPSVTEAHELFRSAGGEDIAGWKLKTASGWDWDTHDDNDGNGGDELCFGALPGHQVDKLEKVVYHIGDDAIFWTSRTRMGMSYDYNIHTMVQTGLEASVIFFRSIDSTASVREFKVGDLWNIRCIKGFAEPEDEGSSISGGVDPE